MFHQIGIEYSAPTFRNPAGSNTIYLDGAVAATGSGESIIPWLGTDTNGFYTNCFTTGSDSSGLEQARGAFLDMYTWTEAYWSYSSGWPTVSNSIVVWQTTLGAGGFGSMMGMTAGVGYIQNFPYTTNYAAYTNFFLAIQTTNSGTQAVVSVQNTQSNLTYNILTNSVLDTNLANW